MIPVLEICSCGLLGAATRSGRITKSLITTWELVKSVVSKSVEAFDRSALSNVCFQHDLR
jgi:hypothetical protein